MLENALQGSLQTIKLKDFMKRLRNTCQKGHIATNVVKMPVDVHLYLHVEKIHKK
jgi:hypothetical protein